jgi:hypothetical protein
MANLLCKYTLHLLLLQIVAAQDKGKFITPSITSGSNVYEVGQRLDIAWQEFEPYTTLSLGIFQPRANQTLEWLISRLPPLLFNYIGVCLC